jgi:hypothetical protein
LLDVPSSDAKARTLATLGLDGSLRPPSPAPRLLGRWWVVGIAGLALLGGGATLLSRSPRSAASEATPSEPAVAHAADVPAPTAVEAQAAISPAVEPMAAPPAASAAVFEKHREGADDLGPQLALIDGARASLAQGNARDALARLKEYDARYPGGSLGPEATALRVDALLQTGERAKGQALGEKFVAQHPNGPYTARIRSLLARTP